MMENAGRNRADFVLTQHGPVSVVILAGAGGNGGGGLVAGRHLANRGTPVTIVLAKPAGEDRAISSTAIQRGDLHGHDYR